MSSFGVLQNIYGVLFKPNLTFKTLIVNYSPSLLLQGVTLFLLVNLISKGFDLLGIVGSFINWLFLCTLLFLAAYVFVLSGHDYWKLITVLAFANLPTIFIAPVDLFKTSLPVLASVLEIILMLWVFNLNLLAVSSVCNISKTKATVLYLLVPLSVSYFVASVLVELFSDFLFA